MAGGEDGLWTWGLMCFSSHPNKLNLLKLLVHGISAQLLTK